MGGQEVVKECIWEFRVDTRRPFCFVATRKSLFGFTPDFRDLTSQLNSLLQFESGISYM